MTYSLTGITVQSLVETDDGWRVTLLTSHTDKVLQVYVSGELAAWREPTGGTATFTLPILDRADQLWFLAVDFADAETDYFDTAFPIAATYANRIELSWYPTGYTLGDVIKLYRGDAGDATATILAYEQEVFPQGAQAIGYGLGQYGYDYGYDSADAPGYGYGYGIGPYGWDVRASVWKSEALPYGTYPVKATVQDKYGNISTETTDTITLDTYPRPASGLTVESYTKATDSLELSWTACPDF